MGGLLLFAAAISWLTGLMMSPHGQSGAGADHVRTSVVVFLRNGAIGNLILCVSAGWLLFPARRPNRPAWDRAIMVLIGAIVLTSLYQLVWLRSVTS